MTRAVLAAAALSAVLTPMVALAQSTRPSGQPASLDAMRGAWTLVYELDESAFRVQEMWQISNPTRGELPASALRLELPEAAKKVRVQEDSGFELVGERVVVPTQPVGPGTSDLTVTYTLPLDGASLQLQHVLPVPMSAGRVIFQRFPGLDVRGLDEQQVREREFDGIGFRIYDLGARPAAFRVEATVSGIPVPSQLPRQIALVLALGALAWMLIGLGDRTRTARPVLGVMSATARRDQILGALELLEKEREQGQIDDQKFRKRREALVRDLSAVLEEIELAAPSPSEAPERT